MTWFKVDDAFHCHPKILEVGNEGAGFYVRCGSYCAQHLTNGFVPAGIALLYGSHKLVKALVVARLWRPVDGGWQIHDYLHYNPSRAQVEAEREAAAQRQKKARERRAEERSTTNGHAVSHSDSHAVTHAVSHGPVTQPRPDPTRPDPLSTSSGHPESDSDGFVAAHNDATPPDGGRRRGTRLPNDFKITDAMAGWAHQHTPHVDINLETEQFRDYWDAKSGRDATKLDWVATWRTWMRKAEQEAGRRRPSAATAPVSRTEVAVASVDNAFAEWEAQQTRHNNIRAIRPAHGA